MIFLILRGRECNNQWASAESFAAVIKDKPGMAVATREVAECTRLMLSFLIDRPVPERIGPNDFPDARWILESSDTPDPTGSRIEQTQGRYKLLMRTDGL